MTISNRMTCAGECVVESHRCSFPFSGSSPGQEHYSCQAAEGGGGGGNQSQHYCRAQVGDRHVSGACNSQCYDLDGVTPAVFEEEDPSAIFCKTEASPCIFPFSWEGATYTACTRDGSEFAWCALQVDSEGGLVGSRWGKCDLATCGDTEEAEQEAREARAVFSGRVAGLLLFSQQSALAPVRIDGRLGGLRDVALVTLKLSAADCATVAVSGGSLGGEEVLEVAANTSTVSLDKWGVSLHPGKQGVVGGSARLEAMECAESGCEVARAIACADIVAGNGRAVSVSTVLTIALVVFCVLLLALTVILVVCCIKRYAAYKYIYIKRR